MASTRLIRMQAVVTAIRSDRVVLVRLKNGHDVVAFAARASSPQVRQLKASDVVMVEMSPCDMSCGRLRFG